MPGFPEFIKQISRGCGNFGESPEKLRKARGSSCKKLLIKSEEKGGRLSGPQAPALRSRSGDHPGVCIRSKQGQNLRLRKGCAVLKADDSVWRCEDERICPKKSAGLPLRAAYDALGRALRRLWIWESLLPDCPLFLGAWRRGILLSVREVPL